MIDLKKLQAENLIWITKNFAPRPTHNPMLGIVEELGELDEAIANRDIEEVKDAVADAIIFASDFCNAMGERPGATSWPLDELWTSARTRFDRGDRTVAIQEAGRLSHAFLKKQQGIRGTPAELDAKMRTALELIFVHLMTVARFHSFEALEATEKVWRMVEQRVWRCQAKDCAKPVAYPGANYCGGACTARVESKAVEART